MRKAHIDYLKPEMKLLVLFLSSGSVLPSSGVELTQRYIDRLKGRGIFNVKQLYQQVAFFIFSCMYY